jgi:hypothetical protein
LAEVEAVAPRVIILHRGRIAADGTPSELVDQLGGDSHVRLEAVVGDAGRAAQLLRSLPGVERVDDDGRLGIHHQFDVFGADDLREDVGALAAAQGWALRELSWRRPTLEELFARIALELDGSPPTGRPEGASASAAPVAQRELPVSGAPLATGDLPILEAEAPAPTSEAPAARTLNPFEGFGSGAPAADRGLGERPSGASERGEGGQ